VREDLAPFRQELSRPVKHVVLAESRGGDLTAAYGIADLIRKTISIRRSKAIAFRRVR
jgi:hypothetical protein